MNDPFAKVAKKNPKVLFNDGQTISSIWFDPEVGTDAGKEKLTKAIQAAAKTFFKVYGRKS